MCVQVGYMFRLCKRPSSGHPLQNNSIKSETWNASTLWDRMGSHFNITQALCLTDSFLAYHLPVSYAWQIQSSTCHPVVVLLQLGLLTILFPSGFYTKILYVFLLVVMCAACAIHLTLRKFNTVIMLGKGCKLGVKLKNISLLPSTV
jgi:hypothetical protein